VVIQVLAATEEADERAVTCATRGLEEAEESYPSTDGPGRGMFKDWPWYV
jgi:hypothetical protein